MTKFAVIQKECKEQTKESLEILPFTVLLDIALTVTENPLEYVTKHKLNSNDIFILNLSELSEDIKVYNF